jgi:hypothetical protein
MDIITVGGGRIKIRERSGGVSGEGLQVTRGAYPVTKDMAHPLGGDLYAECHCGILHVIMGAGYLFKRKYQNLIQLARFHLFG